jgi:hypothetical protein
MGALPGKVSSMKVSVEKTLCLQKMRKNNLAQMSKSLMPMVPSEYGYKQSKGTL